MEKRVVLFLVLSLGIIFGYDLLLKELGYSPFSTGPVLDQEISPGEPTGAAEQTISPSPVTGSDSISSPSSGEPAVPAVIDETIIIDTPLFRAGIAGRGGVITSWELKQYLSQTKEHQPVELVYTQGQFDGPLSVRVAGNEAVNQRLREGIYRIHKDFDQLDERHPTGKVILTYESSEPDDLWVQKEMTVHYDSYQVDLAIRTRGI